MGKKDYLCPELPNQEMLNVHIATMCEPLVFQRSKVVGFFQKKKTLSITWLTPPPYFLRRMQYIVSMPVAI